MSIETAQKKIEQIILKISQQLSRDVSLIRALGKVSELSTAISDINLEATKKASSDLADVRQAEEIMSLVESAQKYKIPTYVDDFVALQPSLKYPAKIPRSLFQSEKVRKVIVEAPGRKPDEVPIDDMFTMLFPGILTFRYGRLMKVPVGRWSPLRIG